ncbi:ATG15 [Candida jiufengensis]|uniref:ATG15 n=1 Tax=Candida jiufengensis TaxID=497108 RepID=UPI0022248400|nr:ATG15 [Candida jiufengensis]KAI5956817.1 ATG15 [Candida jiufengensis]
MISIIYFIIINALSRILLINQSQSSSHPQQQKILLPNSNPEQLNLQLKHIFHHGIGNDDYKIHKRLDITNEYLQKHKEYFINLSNEISTQQEDDDLHDWPSIYKHENPFTIKLPFKSTDSISKRLKYRNEPNFIESYLDYSRSINGNPTLLNKIDLEWIDDDITVPNITDRDTVITLATISSNSYVRFPKDDEEKKKSDWIDVGGWEPNDTDDNINFGWEKIGMRGHVFVSSDNKTVVIGIKGTSGAGLPGGGSDETAGVDKINDNLLFSCCCARVGYMWTTVCDCYEKAYTCNQDCLEKELRRKDRFYQAALDIYKNVTKLYSPETHEIWVTGHSLGGAMASLLGRTYGLPVVAYEAPGEMLATKRLHLPQPPGLPKHMENIWHFGNTADPIYMGVCNGASSSCSLAGYAMETACHTGYQCVYDVVGDKGWRVNLLNHRIHTVIDDIILTYNETAKCVEQPPCRDCFNWRFVSHIDD